MVVRVLNYISNFYLDYVANRKRVKQLPAIFPIVLYNGKRKWTAKQELAELIEAEPALGDYALHFKYLLLDEKMYNRQHLLTIRNIVSTLFLAETHYDIQLLEAELLNLYEREDDKQAVSLFLNWFRQLAMHGKVPPEDYTELDSIYRTKEEVQTMLAATFEEERKKIYQAGREEGRIEVQHTTILQLLAFRFEIDEAGQGEFRQRLLKMQDQTVLTKLLNCLLRKESQLEDFIKLLNTALTQPTNQQEH